jgi:hypothetical protein
MKKTTVLLFAVVLMLFLVLTGCESMGEDSDETLKKQTEQSMREANAQIGMPSIVNFQERKLAKMIFELRDKEDLICYAYLKSDYTGELVFIGRCIGYGLPYSVQYTNPEKRMPASASNGGTITMPQADPNGLFMPQELSATWLMLIDPETDEGRPVYIEPEIVVSPFKLK